MTKITGPSTVRIRVGQAAEMLQVSVETLRRWETEGRLRMERSEGGQRLVDIGEVSRLLDERREGVDRPTDRRPVGTQPVPGHRHAHRDAIAWRPSSRSSPARIGWSAS